MKILSIDPGTTHSGWCYYDTGKKKIIGKGKDPNEDLRINIIPEILNSGADVFVYEMVACYGMPVGESVFETVLWMGQFLFIAWESIVPVKRLFRKDVKIALCGSMKAKDTNIRQAIIDRFQASGGGKTPQIGTKKEPGPLYGVSKDIWSALGLCLAYEDSLKDING